MKQRKSPCWAEVDLDNLRFNINEIKKLLKKDTKLCCVLKADAYGHGAVELAKALEKENVDYFAVARIEEGFELRRGGVTAPILVLASTCPFKVEEAIEQDITMTVDSLEMAKDIDCKAKALGEEAKIHIKIDTGMNRIGFKSNEESIKEILEINKFKNLDIEGIFTHFATADEGDKHPSEKQIANYRYITDELEKQGMTFRIKHVSNSAAVIDLPDLNLNMVRPGIIQYGHYPSDEVLSDRLELKPLMKLKSTVTNVKTIEKGARISYGLTYVADSEQRIATIAIGYGDGYTRLQKNPKVFIKGKMYDVVGRICMDQCMVKLDCDSEVNIGDEVVIFGEGEATVERIAKDLGTINYEVLCMVSRRVDRVYMENNKIAKVKSYLLE
ncbi:MAG: alanine racemase [Clostridioides sp.]|jgi:alanine racemase|nr:alanine racemase [Clostridioides sp.]